MATKRFLQTSFWAEFKGAHGWTPYYFVLEKNALPVSLNREEGATRKDNLLVVLVRSFSLKIKKFSLAYIPMAPEYLEDKEVYFKRLYDISQELKKYLPKNTLFVRFDPPIDFSTVEERDNFNLSFKSITLPIKKSLVDIQPPDTVILPLNKTPEELLSNMKSKWRYNIKLAAKKGVVVSKHFASDSDFDSAFDHFYELFCQTSERDGVSFHNKEYYKDLLIRSAKNSSKENILVTLYLAHHEDDYLAGIITLFYVDKEASPMGKQASPNGEILSPLGEALYLYGASGNVKRNYMPAYLLQWTAIQDAIKFNCPVYDFYGIPPTDKEDHPMHGLYLFKTGFGGNIVHRPGSFDIPLRSSYKIYEVLEKARAWWFKKAVKKLKGR